MAKPTPAEIAAEDALVETGDALKDLDDQKLAQLDSALTPIPELADLLAEATGWRPHVRVDITDPPTPIGVIVGELEATAPSADAAMRVVAPAAARAIRAARTAGAGVEGVA